MPPIPATVVVSPQRPSLGSRDEPVRVCFVIDQLRVGGTERQLLQLITGLDRRRVVPYLCLLRGEDEISRSWEPEDCPLLRLDCSSLSHPAVLRDAWRFARFLRQSRIDLVQTYFPDSTYFAAPVARLAGIRHVVRTRRDLGYWMKPVDRCLGRLYNRIVTMTVANCEACRRAVIDQERAVPDSVTVLENGLELEPLERIPPLSLADNGQARRVGMVANLRPVKALEVFVAAAAVLAAQFPAVSFHIAGGGDEAPLRKLIRRCALEDRCRLYGSVGDIPAFLHELDVAVLTSYSEGLSNAILEYMAAARPIVATAVGANLELINDGVHGLLVPPGNPEAVAAAIARLLEDRPFAASLGIKARQRAAHRYSREAMLRRYEDFYLNLVRSHRRQGSGRP